MRKGTLALCAAILLILAFSAALVSACSLQAGHRDSLQASTPAGSPAAAISPVKVVREMLGQVDRTRALEDLRRLTGEEPICTAADCYTITNRLTGSEGLRRATDYLAGELEDLGYSVEFREWSRRGRSDRNLIARKPGVVAPREEVYFVAHVDGVGPNNVDRFPAADDNASGVVDLLEVARVLSSHQFSRTLVLLFSTGEEQGTLGVRSYLDELSDPELAAIKVAVDVDVIGYDGNDDRVMELWHGDGPKSMVVTQMMSDTIRAYRLDLVPAIAPGCG